MNWKLTEKIDFYTEFNYISMTYYAGEYNLTQDKNLVTGFNNLTNMTLSQKQVLFCYLPKDHAVYYYSMIMNCFK